MKPTDRGSKDIDAELGESARLIREMNVLIARGGLLLRDRQKAIAASEMIHATPGTLGAVLYARPSQVPEGERSWVSLIRSAGARDQFALQALWERTQYPVATLVQRIAGDRDDAERLTLEVFHDVWRQADRYDAAKGTVLAWVMNLARARAVGRKDGNVVAVSAHDLAALRLEPSSPPWSEPAWDDVAPGISVKLLATDADRHMVSMLVRLVPGGEYPAHTHAGIEELHLLEGELWIDERKLYPGDYNRAEPGTGDKRVWSETGCTCVLVTSTRDILG